MDHLDFIDLHMDNLRPLHQLTNNLHHKLVNLDHLDHNLHHLEHLDHHMKNLEENMDDLDHAAGLRGGGTGWWGITNLVECSILAALDISCLLMLVVITLQKLPIAVTSFLRLLPGLLKTSIKRPAN